MNSIYLGTSIDGYIADRNGGLEWLDSVPNPDGNDMGYFAFMGRIDALVMGRKTFETVLGFDVDWPYEKPVYVLSNSMNQIPVSHAGKAFLVSGNIKDVLNDINNQGHTRLYIDGGKLVQSFLAEDLIDEMILTTIPILLGGGMPLFGELKSHMHFDLMNSKVILGHVVQQHYKRKR